MVDPFRPYSQSLAKEEAGRNISAGDEFSEQEDELTEQEMVPVS
jgi:hypothetical protein